MLSIGIVGLPNVGKSTLFNALTCSKQAQAQNYPFCTIEPNVGIVEVPDARLAPLAATSQSGKIIPTAIQFVDIAGLVAGASEGAGLGNKFLSHIREVDAIAHVVRSFADDNVIHVANRVDPLDDAKVINLELLLADLQTVSKKYETTKGRAKGNVPKEVTLELAMLERLKAHLEKELPARGFEVSDDEAPLLYQLQLLTRKPMMYIVNCADIGTACPDVEPGVPQVAVCARVEEELVDFSPEEAKEFLRESGQADTGLDRVITAGYALLRLVTFFTSGEMETRAWTVRSGAAAPEAAGVIHTDFVKGFVKADVVRWQDFVDHGGWSGIKTTGKMRLEGKTYIVRDGDVCYFHIA
jgi:ribosome-binding ATPase